MRKTLLVASAALMLAAGPTMAQQKSIKIGFVSTFSGPIAAIGNDMRNSFELALDHMGRKMGGLPVEVIYEDDGFKPEVGKQKTEKLIESDKVDFISGYIWSNVLLASIKPIVDSKTFLIIANAGPSQVAGELCSPYVFSTSWQNDQTPQAMGVYMNSKGLKSVFLIGPNYAAGKDMLAGVRVHLQGQGRRTGADHLAGPARLLRRAVEGESRQSGRDLRVLSRRGRRAVPHPIRAGGFERQNSAVHRLHHRRAVAAAAKRTRARRTRRAGVGERSAERGQQEVRGRLQGQVQKPSPSFYGAQSYDAANLIASAVAATKGNLSDKEALRNAIEKANFNSVRGNYKFGNNHVPIQNFYLQDVVKDAKGDFVLKTVDTIVKDNQDSFHDKCPMK